MPRYFVTDPLVAVHEFEPGSIVDAETGQERRPNTIYIRPRMDVETKGRVTADLVTAGPDGKNVQLRLGASEVALLVHNILRWEGPDLDSTPCTPEAIRKLDPSEPHIARVLAEIAARNRPRVADDPKRPGGSGVRPDGSLAARLAVVPVGSRRSETSTSK